jgi:glycosyltransferase involved in cell wall biosynthesis
MVSTTPGHAARGPEPWLWIKDFMFVLKQGARAFESGSRADLFVGIDNLNAFAGLVLRALGRTGRVAYYVIDYTPRRFSNPVLNWIYGALDRVCVRRADVIWNLSTRMQEVRRGQGAAEKKNQVVPVGVALDEVARIPRAKVRRKTLVYMGALQRSKGVQMLIEALPLIRGRVKGAQLHIFGLGDYESTLRDLAASSPDRRAIFFHGPLERSRLFKVLPGYGVALAPYLEEAGSYTYWADATKPKEYLACGLPLIITRVPWIWERVADARHPLGVAVSYNREEVVQACARLMRDPAFYWRCRRNALDFASGLDWRDIYDRAFRELPW